MQVVSKDKLSSMVGDELGTSEWFTIDQDRINEFADVTVDHQFIHIDEEKAAQTPLGGTIAHGFLTLSLTVHLTSQINVAHTKLLEVSEKGPGQMLLKTGVTVEIEGEEKPALVAEMLTMAVTAG